MSKKNSYNGSLIRTLYQLDHALINHEWWSMWNSVSELIMQKKLMWFTSYNHWRAHMRYIYIRKVCISLFTISFTCFYSLYMSACIFLKIALDLSVTVTTYVVPDMPWLIKPIVEAILAAGKCNDSFLFMSKIYWSSWKAPSCPKWKCAHLFVKASSFC
jgi:hypothetical protein